MLIEKKIYFPVSGVGRSVIIRTCKSYLQFFINNTIWTKTLSNITLAFRQVKKVINYINTVSYVHSKKNKNYSGNVTHVERKR